MVHQDTENFPLKFLKIWAIEIYNLSLLELVVLFDTVEEVTLLHRKGSQVRLGAFSKHRRGPLFVPCRPDLLIFE